jgi:DNA primase large subunit
MEIQKHDDYFVIPVPDYLKHATHFHEKEWKLVNRLVDNGNVFLSAHETVRLIRKELDNFISSKIQSASIPRVPDSFKKPVSDLVNLAKKFSVQFVETTEYPPCIKHAIEVLSKGENLPHSGRFMLATYLLNKGQTIEDIAPLFKNAPDYNEKVTLYQLKHLAGNFGSGTKYSCPSCDKLKSENLCYAIPECDNIINPLQFGRKKITNA